MTNKEAIDVIMSMGLIVDSVTHGKRRQSVYEALTLAVNALEEVEETKREIEVEKHD